MMAAKRSQKLRFWRRSIFKTEPPPARRLWLRWRPSNRGGYRGGYRGGIGSGTLEGYIKEGIKHQVISEGRRQRRLTIPCETPISKQIQLS